MLGVLISG